MGEEEIRVAPERLRIAFLTYRGNPYCGGQGVYAFHLTRGLAALGHEVTVFSGQPYPRLDPRVGLVRIPSLDLYREADPFRWPKLRELTSPTDLLEIATMATGGFPEPRTFSLRVRESLRTRLGEFDLVHDNQCLGSGIARLVDDGWPVVCSIHHPVGIDLELELARAESASRRLTLRRWYGFVGMQTRAVRRLGHLITVSTSSAHDIAERFGVDPTRLSVIPVGVDPEQFRPMPDIARIPGRLMTTASSDVALKGLAFLLEAVAKIRADYPQTHLVVIGQLRADSPLRSVIDRFDLGDAVEFVSGVTDEEIVRKYASCTAAVVPSLYEGFSLPAVEAMACGVPLVVTSGGALPEVVGADGRCARVVAPGDAGAIAAAVGELFAEPLRARELGREGRARALDRFSWDATAAATVMSYRAVLEGTARC